jgi:arylsulfatase A-like enzyme
VPHTGLGIILGQGFGIDASKYARRLKTIRTEEYKYIWSSNGQDELYNIREDPGELNNLIEVEPEKAAELKALLKQWLNSFETYRPGVADQIR